MKKLTIAVLAGMISVSLGAYAAEDMKKDSKSGSSSMSKGGSASSSSSAAGGASAPTTTTTDMPKDTGGKRSRAARASRG